MMFLLEISPPPVAQVRREEDYPMPYQRRGNSPADTLVSGGDITTPLPEYAISAQPTQSKSASQTTTQSRLITQIKIVRTPFGDLISQLAECLQNVDDSMDVSQSAATRIFHLLSETQQHLCRDGDLYPDGDGGLRIEWDYKTRQVRLVIHASDEREDYLYWQEGKEHYIETLITAASLIEWQKWLRGNIK